jgi:hypothetical protein
LRLLHSISKELVAQWLHNNHRHREPEDQRQEENQPLLRNNEVGDRGGGEAADEGEDLPPLGNGVREIHKLRK